MVNSQQQSAPPIIPTLSCMTESAEPSIQNNTHMDSYPVLTDDVSNALLRAAKLGFVSHEIWLGYNACCSLWNYSHKVSERYLVEVCRELLPIIKQVDLGRYVIYMCLFTLQLVSY